MYDRLSINDRRACNLENYHIISIFDMPSFSFFQAFVYEGKTGEMIGELGTPAHKGGIYGVSRIKTNVTWFLDVTTIARNYFSIMS